MGYTDMRRIAYAGFAILATGLTSGTAALAGSLDRSNQDVGVLFEDGDHLRLSFGYVRPDVTGDDRQIGAGTDGTGDVASNYFNGALGYKQQLTDALSFALIVDQPYGADIAYAEGSSGNLGGTEAILNTASVAGYLRYEFPGGFSVHGGLRSQKFDARVRLAGEAYNLGGALPLNDYAADFDGDSAVGWQAGVAYEVPAIALRVALTYHSEIDHDLDTVETSPAFGGAARRSSTELTTPEALNLDFQTGVAEGTLVFGSLRYAAYDDVVLSPDDFDTLTGGTGASIVSIDPSLDARIGVARRIGDDLAGLAVVSWTRPGEDDAVSPLAPTNGALGLSLGGVYDVNDALSVTAAVNYTRIRDAIATVAGVSDADFEDNDAVGVGIQLGYSF